MIYLEFTKEEFKWLQDFARKRIEAEKAERAADKKIMDFKKDILSGKLKDKKNSPKWICKDCGKVIIRNHGSWGLAVQFPEKKYRCNCD